MSADRTPPAPSTPGLSPLAALGEQEKQPFLDVRRWRIPAARRDTEPGAWYPKSAAGVLKFDDLPPELAGSVKSTEVPDDRKAGGKPSLTPGEIDGVVAFLETLDDGYN